jgi:predicted component of viral defense system (DUF524 family)
MSSVAETSVAIIDRSGRRQGRIRIALLPGWTSANLPPLVEVDGSGQEPLESIQLLEDWEYYYQIEGLPGVKNFKTDRAEIFLPDSEGSEHGRLRPGSRAGLLSVVIKGDSVELGTASMEIRSRKLDYLSHYRWMLRDLAKAAGNVVMERFAAVQQRFNPNESLEPQTAYERFALVQGLLLSPFFRAAFQEILASPHRGWRTEMELRSPGLGIPANSVVVRELLKNGSRIGWSASTVPGLTTIPRVVEVGQVTVTLDTVPNQCLKFALTEWIGLVSSLAAAIEKLSPGPTLERARKETSRVLETLTVMLAEPIFRTVSDLDHFPSENQVLQRREGYRDFFQLYAMVNAAAQLIWSRNDRLFTAGQRDVSTLYEYWAFLQLLESLRSLCWSFDVASLIRPSQGMADVTLAQGNEIRLSGMATRLDRSINVELFFNRGFSKGSGGSWTRPMRPDCSVRLTSATERSNSDDEVWVHFDAKYRIDHLQQIFGPPTPDDEGTSEQKAAESAGAKRDDLLKMHAYRDAIQRSAGAYVLYPGASEHESEKFRQYHEILPGLGAFALRPGEFDSSEGRAVLDHFLDDILTHFASVLSQDRRARYWERESFSESTRVNHGSGWAPDTVKPAADTKVLLGYVRSQRQLEWIIAQRRYNLRVGDRRGNVGLTGPEIGSQAVLLYGPTVKQPTMYLVDGQPEIWTSRQMIGTGYPEPGGDLYLCLPLAEASLRVPQKLLTLDGIARVRFHEAPKAVSGAPVVTSWLQLAR